MAVPKKIGIGIQFLAMQRRLFPLWAPVVHGDHVLSWVSKTNKDECSTHFLSHRTLSQVGEYGATVPNLTKVYNKIDSVYIGTWKK